MMNDQGVPAYALPADENSHKLVKGPQKGIGAALQCCDDATWSVDPLGETWSCSSCERSMHVHAGIHYLVAETEAHNRLEEVAYDEMHGVDLAAIRKNASVWEGLIDRHATRVPSRVLELGAGTGFLTVGLSLIKSIQELFVTDISGPFLMVAKGRVEAYGSSGKRTEYFAADIQDLPFKPGSFDLIVGNSILHHIFDYGALLSRCSTLLADGGIAIFNEPVLQGKLVVAFLLRVIVDTDEISGHHLSPEECKRIRELVWLLTKEKWLKGNDKFRRKMEDKHIFDLQAFARNAEGWGFSKFSSENASPMNGGCRTHVELMLRIMGLKANILDRYQYVFDGYQEVVLDLIGTQIKSPHQYIVFRK